MGCLHQIDMGLERARHFACPEHYIIGRNEMSISYVNAHQIPPTLEPPLALLFQEDIVAPFNRPRFTFSNRSLSSTQSGIA